MITTTDAEVLETLRQVVSERPEYVYSAPEYMEPNRGAKCFYVHKDERGANVSAGCVVGVVLHRLGMPLEELADREGDTALQVMNRLVEGTSGATRSALLSIQEYQDEGTAWGTAYAMATGETI
ncbi:hypothetical protein [Streptomyces sp. NPDC004682]